MGLFITFLGLAFYELFYWLEFGGSLAWVLLIAFIANAVMAYKMMDN